MTLILVGTQPRVIFPVLRAARYAGHTAVLVGPAGTQGMRWSALCARHVLANLTRTEQAGEVLHALLREHPGATIVPCDCDGIRLLHRLADPALPTIPMPEPGTLDTLDDKWSFHQLCEAQGLPVPETVRAASREDLQFDEIARVTGLPFIVKPTCESGSRGVVVVNNARDLREKVIDDPRYPAGPVIAQRFIHGEDIDADLLAVGGQVRVLTIHRVRGHWMEFGRHAGLEEMASELCRTTGFSGPMNIDARLERDTGRVYLVEANPRFWASVDMPLAAGLDFLAECLSPPLQLRRLSPSRVNRRHPLLRPRDWPHLLTANTPDARLARTSMFDAHAGASLLRDVPAMATRRLAAVGRLAGTLTTAPPLRHAPPAVVPWQDTHSPSA
jgi:hypothetical protein